MEALDLSAFYEQIKAVEGGPGRDAIDPRLMLALWIFATTEGVGSARLIARLCERDLAYLWLCGGVGMNYHSLADFRALNAERFEKLLTKHLAALTSTGVVQLQRVVQDGVRVRADAGSSSFRRRAKLEEFEQEAKEQVEALAREVHSDPQASERRKSAAKKRAIEERAERVRAALARARELEARKAETPSHKSKADQEKTKRKTAKGEVRASTTDPDAHRMKMGDGGYRPAYNVQVAMDPASGFVVGTMVTNEGLDGGMLPLMVDKLTEQHNASVQEVVADGGFVTMKAIDQLHEKGVKIYAPVDKPRSNRDPHKRLRGDSEAVGAWRERMGTGAGKTVYGLRPRVEWIFARMRNWGLRQFAVRTKPRVSSSFLLYTLTHNFLLDIARLKILASEPKAA